MIRLQHQRPDGEIDTYHLKAGRRYHVGRGSHCELRILDLKLSRKHCAVFFDRGIWHVEDMSSTNGCKLDDKPVLGTAALNVGSKLVVGQTALQVASIDSDESGLNAGPVPSDSIQLNIDEPKEAPAKKPETPAAKGPDGLVHTDDLNFELDTALLPSVKDEPKLEQVEVKEAPTAVRSDAELNANSWLPEPDNDHHIKTDTLQPIKPANKKAPAVSPPAQSAAAAAATKPASFPTPLPVPAPQLAPRSVTPPSLPSRTSAVDPKSDSAKLLAQAQPEKNLRPASPPASAPPKPADSGFLDLNIDISVSAIEPAKPAAAATTAEPLQGTSPAKPQPIKPITIRVGNSDAPTAPNFSDPPSSLANRPAPRMNAAPAPTPKPAPPPAKTPPAAAVSTPKPAPAPTPRPMKSGTEKLLKSHPNTDSLERTFFINVLGKRIGPLTRAEARELKTKELKGTLTESDLEGFPQA